MDFKDIEGIVGCTANEIQEARASVEYEYNIGAISREEYEYRVSYCEKALDKAA